MVSRRTKVVKKKTKRKRPVAGRKKGFSAGILFVFLVLIAVSCLYIWQRVTVVALAGRTKELKLKIESKQETLKYLQIEVTRLGSVERIEEKGKQMGLVYPTLDKIEWIRESSDSVYLEQPYPPGSIWAKLTALQRKLLPGDEAVAREIRHEP
jgi:cell division protein FtsL